MGNSQTVQKVNFEDIQYVIKNHENFILINTLKESDQTCLILNTLHYREEENIINKLLKNNNKEIKIIIYGPNCNDCKIYTKYNQLINLGFYNIYIYVGGIFEWIMLQDIYGDDEFPTTIKEIDILKFKPNKILNIQLIGYN